jgi:hypothetical protein
MTSKTERLIEELPQDIKSYIFYEFIRPKMYCTLFQDAILLRESKMIDIRHIRKYLPYLLFDPCIVSFLSKNQIYFKKVYDEHKIIKNKSYVKKTNGDSFALALLMYIYH